MKKNRLLIRAFLILLVLSANSFAGDYSHFHFIGFSRDGKYLAFEEYGINDDVDDSSPYSSIYIIDVRKNEWAIAPFKATGDDSIFDETGQYDSDKIETEVRNKNRRRAARQLKRFRIIDGNTGLQVAAHLINEYKIEEQEKYNRSQNKEMPSLPAAELQDIPADSNTSLLNSNTSPSNSNVDTSSLKSITPDPFADYVEYLPQQIAFTKRGNALYHDGYYELKLKPVPVRQKNCDEYERDMFSFELTLKNESNETRVLQTAGTVPKNRGCVNGYGIQEAYLYQNQLVVFIGIMTRGWEGENLRLMAVTGNLD